MEATEGRKIEKWKVKDLKPHPRQRELFGEPTTHEIRELAEKLKRGLDHPLEILPDGTILAGHRRRAAAMLLGWETIDVVVRHDVAGQGVEAAERRLIEDNLDRRQMGPLAIARCYQALKTLGRHRGDRLCDSARQELRDEIGERLEVSGRTLDRYLRVLELTPPEVQNAVEAGQLPVTVAEKVAGLKKPQKEQIAKAIREGGNPAEVVRGFLAPSAGRHKRTTDAVDAFLRGLVRGVNDLEGRVAKAPVYLNAEGVILLDKAVGIIGQIRARAIKFQQDMLSADADNEPTAQGNEAEATDDESEEEQG